jgi:hypothetical protein
MAFSSSSSSVFLTNVDDYLAPSQACVNPLFSVPNSSSLSATTKEDEQQQPPVINHTATTTPTQQVVIPRQQRRRRRPLATTPTVHHDDNNNSTIIVTLLMIGRTRSIHNHNNLKTQQHPLLRLSKLPWPTVWLVLVVLLPLKLY